MSLKRAFSLFASLVLFLALILEIPAFASVGSTSYGTEPPGTSETAPVETTKAEIIPGKVTGLKASKITSKSFVLSWKKTKGCKGYNIYIYSEKKGKYRRVDITDRTKYTITGLKASHVYSFKIRGIRFGSDYEFKLGKSSKALKVRTAPGKAGTPFSTDIGKDFISISWKTVKDASAYRVYMFSRNKGKYVCLGSTKKNEFSVPGLSKGLLYSFKVRAVYKGKSKKLFGDFSDELFEFTRTSGKIHTNAQAAKYYNSVINSAKQRKNVRVSYSKKVSTKAEKTSKYSLLMTVRNLLNMFKGTKNETFSFKNGYASGKSIDSLIQPYNKSARIRGKDIKSFSYKIKDGKKLFSLVLVSDSSSVDGKNKKISSAPTTSRAMKLVNITKKRIIPVSIRSGTQNYEGVRFTLSLSGSDAIETLKIKNKVNVDASCAVSSLKFDAKGSYTVTENYTFG